MCPYLKLDLSFYETRFSRSCTCQVVTLLAYRILAELYYKKRKTKCVTDIVHGTKIDDEIGFPLVTW